jgi:hypothetical protein
VHGARVVDVPLARRGRLGDATQPRFVRCPRLHADERSRRHGRTGGERRNGRRRGELRRQRLHQRQREPHVRPGDGRGLRPRRHPGLRRPRRRGPDAAGRGAARASRSTCGSRA